MTIKKTNIKVEVFSNQGPVMILVYADDTDTVGTKENVYENRKGNQKSRTHT